MEVIFDGHNVRYTGLRFSPGLRGRQPKAQIPKKAMNWTGAVAVSGIDGEAVEVPWSTKKGQPLTYAQAKDAIWQAVRLAQEEFRKAYEFEPEQSTFRMTSR